MAGMNIENIEKTFGAALVLREVSLKNEEREFLTLLGQSGCRRFSLKSGFAKRPNTSSIFGSLGVVSGRYPPPGALRALEAKRGADHDAGCPPSARSPPASRRALPKRAQGFRYR